MTTFTSRTIPTTSYTGRSTVNTTFTGRTIFVTNSVSPIITGFWNDLNTWSESGKFWNDNGDTGANWTGRITP